MNFGAFPFPFPATLETELDKAIVTPAENIAQYSLLGAFAGLGLAAVAAFGFDLVPKQNRLTTFGLLAVPAIGAAVGVALAARRG